MILPYLAKNHFFADFESRFSDFISKTVRLQLQQCPEQFNLSLLQLSDQ